MFGTVVFCEKPNNAVWMFAVGIVENCIIIAIIINTTNISVKISTIFIITPS